MAATYGAPEVARLAGISEWLLYKSIREGTCPFPFIRLGVRRIVFPKAAVNAMLGIETSTEAIG